MTNSMSMKKILTLLVLATPFIAAAQNPVVRDQFAADPTARVFNNKVYLYPSHDIPAPDDFARKDWFCMADYHVFSSDDLIDWQDHGVILSQEQVPWGQPRGYSMWAPDCVEKNGKYYFYFPNAPRQGRGFSVGVATADRPEGPFSPETEPIRGVMGIDPCVLIDRDGQAYIYWSGMGIRGARLKDNMTELADPLETVSLRQGENMTVGGKQMEGLPEGFKEGPFVFRRGDWYYLTFPWVRGQKTEDNNPTETLAYAMSKSPLGPWDFKGIIMAEHANGCWTNHHSIVEYHGQWYLFYHHNDYSPAFDKNRSPHADLITFRPDGTIVEVKPTLRGVGIMPATHRIDIDRFSSVSLGVTTDFIDTANTFRGWHAIFAQKGQWLTFDQVDFSMLREDAYVTAAVRAQQNGSLTLREGNAKGKVMARFDIRVESTGQFRRDQRGQWISITAPLTYIPAGTAALCLVNETDGQTSVDRLQFKNRPRYFTPVVAGAAPSQPDEAGFIRRWMLLEPIKQDIRSNVIFTNTWLRETFSKTYFKDQMTIVPRDGQKVKAGKQTLAWHALDSENYNVKLFRFAEKWGQQTYGSLFWAVTVIDCPEDIPGVRLAAGSNGASIWWLNGEEVLMLEGDRRMVEDDGMSARLTLKKGRNILRGAVVNGPGLSDMCVRFLDENNQPITNLHIQ